MPTLIITEKPNVAERIAKSLGNQTKKSNKGVSYFESGDYFIAPAVGHIYGLMQTDKKGWVYPVFDIEWVPSYKISKGSDFTKKYLTNIKELAKKCDRFINACDYDIEGEVIGYNVIKHACGADPRGDKVKRVKYSTLTNESLKKAFENIGPIDQGMADAGITRHTLDWYWGINLSRALTNAARMGRHYSTLSIGRVQGPTLKLLASREKKIAVFEPETYFHVEMLCEKGEKFTSLHELDRILDRGQAEDIVKRCGNSAKVVDIESSESKQPAPYPFDLTTLQTEAYRHLKIDPRKTLEIAQTLYTNAFISYPRTSSQQIPEEIDCRAIIEKIKQQPLYSGLCEKLLAKKKLKPVKGKKTDAAHPAIHPTGEQPPKLEKETQALYDLIVRRFIASFAETALRQTQTVKLDNQGEIFIAKGNTTTFKGWHEFYGPYAKFDEIELPPLEKGEIVKVLEVLNHEKQTKPPKRYTPASIIKEMEKRDIGTKATRSQIVDILFKRGYINGKSLEVSDLGMTVVSAMDKYCPDVISEKLTRQFEKEMDQIQTKKMSPENVLSDGRESLTKILKLFKENEKKIGETLAKSIQKSKNKENTIGVCPQCSENLIIMRIKFGGQFIGCSGYPDCRYTIPLSKDSVSKGKKCPDCEFLTLNFSPKQGKRYTLCVNPECKSKANQENIEKIGPCLKCGSDLIVRRSRFGTKFIGCSGYPKCTQLWSLPKEDYEKTDDCGLCGYPMIVVKPQKSTEYETCVNPECEKYHKKEDGLIGKPGGTCPKCKSDMVFRKSRYDTLFLGCSGYPKCRNIWPLPKEGFDILGKCDACNSQLIKGKKDDSVPETCVNPDCGKK